MSSDFDVLVIGAGLAGLRCASVLARHGLAVQVWEAADRVGGRVRTDIVDGFRCDRGFQVLNPAYPELPRAVDVSALNLQSFDAGIAFRGDDGAGAWNHPLRAPRTIPGLLTGSGLGVTDFLALGRWALPALRPHSLTAGAHDVSMREALDRCGVKGLPRRVMRRFLSGVVLDDEETTSNSFVLLLARMFALGVPGLPAAGMQALPDLMAEKLSGRIEFGRKATRIAGGDQGWHVTDGHDTVRARHAVVATDPHSAATLTGVPAPPMKGVVTDWWATDDEMSGPAMVWVDGRSRPTGPVVNTSVISKAAPTYAPAGRHLVAASALIDTGDTAPTETDVRNHAADILGVDGSAWSPLIRHVITDALPAQRAPLQVRSPIRTPAGLWLCGDHRDTASIQGALVSGRRVADAIIGRR